MPTTVPSHIEINDQGRAIIAGSRFKVRMLVVDIQQGMTPDEMVKQFPPLTLAQIHAALSYYYDHQAEIDAEIRECDAFVAEIEAQTPSNRVTRAELEQRLRDRGIQL